MSGTSTGPSGIPALPAVGSYDTANQLTSAGVGYDGAGDQTTLGALALSYDGEGRQTSAMNSVTATTVNYGASRRIRGVTLPLLRRSGLESERGRQ